jgi:hypothetical protein
MALLAPATKISPPPPQQSVPEHGQALTRGRKRTSLLARFASIVSATCSNQLIDCSRGFGVGARERGLLTSFQYPFGLQNAVKLDELGHQPGPAGLMAGAQPGTVVAMEVLVKENVIRKADGAARDNSQSNESCSISRWPVRYIWLWFPVDPVTLIQRMAPPVSAHRFVDSGEEHLIPEACKQAEALQLVLYRIFHLGET